MKTKPACAQPCPTLCGPMDCSLLGSSVHGIFQARLLEWVAISHSGDLSDLGSNMHLLLWQADSLPLEPPGKPKAEPLTINYQPHWHVLILFTKFKISLRSDSRNWNKLTGQMPKSILILCSLKNLCDFYFRER